MIAPAYLSYVIEQISRAVDAHTPTPPDRDTQRPSPVSDYCAYHHHHFVTHDLTIDLSEVKLPWLDTLLQFIPLWNRDMHDIRFVFLSSRIGTEFMTQTKGYYPGHGANDFYKNNCAPSFERGLIGTIGGRASVTVLRNLEPSAKESIIAF